MHCISPVFLRCGLAATLTGAGPVAGFALLGRLSDGTLELWDARGRWREDGADHPLDIVSILQDGQPVPFHGLPPG